MKSSENLTRFVHFYVSYNGKKNLTLIILKSNYGKKIQLQYISYISIYS